MTWVTWTQSAVVCVIALGVWLIVRRHTTTQRSAPAFKELGIITGLYSVWRLGLQLPLTHESGALERARWINDLQMSLPLPTEVSVQRAIVDHDWIARFANDYYAIAHVPALIVFMVWLFVRHRDHYPHWRNGLAALTGASLFIHFIRVAPPRFIDELGFVDLSQRYGFDVYGPAGSAVSDQFAAMPSIHVGWAAVVALGTVAASRSPWRWVVFAHLPLTVFVVSATGHHWWADGIVAVALLLVGLGLDTLVRRRARDRTTSTGRIEPASSVPQALAFGTVLPELPIDPSRPRSTTKELP